MLFRCCRVKACHVISQQTISFASSHLGWPISADSLCLGDVKISELLKTKQKGALLTLRTPAARVIANVLIARWRVGRFMKRADIFCANQTKAELLRPALFTRITTRENSETSLSFIFFSREHFIELERKLTPFHCLFFISCFTFLGAQRLTHFIPIWFGVCLRGSRLSWKLIQ